MNDNDMGITETTAFKVILDAGGIDELLDIQERYFEGQIIHIRKMRKEVAEWKRMYAKSHEEQPSEQSS